MKKNSFYNTKIKSYLNFSFKDADAGIASRNRKIFNASIKALAIYLFVILPIFAYTYVALKNDNLTFYINYRSDENFPIWHYLEIGNGYLVKSFLIAGYVLLAVSLIMILFFKPVVTATKAKKITMHGYLVAIGIIVILTLLLFGVSQYEYARFFEYYKYSQLFPDSSLKQDWAKGITDQFKDTGTKEWAWASTNIVIWIMFVQIMLSFTFFVLLQNVIFDSFQADKDSTKYLFMMDAEQNNNASDLALNNRFWKRWRLFAHNDQRNLTIYIIVGSIAVLISGTVYSVLVTSNNTNISSLTEWNYATPYFLRDLKGFIDPTTGRDVYEQIFGMEINSLYYGSLFLVSSLQIICLGFTFSVLFFFITSFIRSKRVSYKIFFIQIMVLFVFLLLTVTAVLLSKLYLYRIQDLWNTGTNSADLKAAIQKSLGNDEKIWAGLTAPNAYPEHDIFNKGFKIEWLGFYPTIAEGILVYAFIIGLFVTVVINNQKLRNRTKEAIEWINEKRGQAIKDLSQKAKTTSRKIKKVKEEKVHEKTKNRKANKRSTRRNRGKTEE